MTRARIKNVLAAAAISSARASSSDKSPSETNARDKFANQQSFASTAIVDESGDLLGIEDYDLETSFVSYGEYDASFIQVMKDKPRSGRPVNGRVGGDNDGLGLGPTGATMPGTASHLGCSLPHIERVPRDKIVHKTDMPKDSTGYQQYGPKWPWELRGNNQYPMLEMIDRMDSQLWISMNVGSPPTTLRTVFDTGSTNIWFLCDECTEHVCTNHNPHMFGKTKSATYHDVPNAWKGQISFATGALSGYQMSDKIWLSKTITIDNQPFNAITGMHGDIFEVTFKGFEGIVGSAFPEMAVQGSQEHTFVNNLARSLDVPKFGFYVNKRKGFPGYVTFGAEKGDPRFYTGPTWTAPVTHAYWWTIKLKSFRVGTHELVSDGGNLVVDTGTTNFAAPSDMRPQILQASKGGSNGEYLPWHFEIYCDAPASGYEAAVPGGKQPNTHNYCDGSSKTFTLTFQPDDYLIGRSDGKKRVALQAIDLQNRAMFFGAHSLRKFYSVYDPKGIDGVPNIMFAEAKPQSAFDVWQYHAEAVDMDTDGGELTAAVRDKISKEMASEMDGGTRKEQPSSGGGWR